MLKQPKQSQDIYKSQAYLIKMALELEESNIASHRNYLITEEEKRMQATTVHRSKVIGPRLRWISKGERMKPHHFYMGHQNSGFWNGAQYGYLLGQQLYQPQGSAPRYYTNVAASQGEGSNREGIPNSTYTPSTSGKPADISSKNPAHPVYLGKSFADPAGSRNSEGVIGAKPDYTNFYYPNYNYVPNLLPLQNTARTENSWKHTTNYIVHQLSDEELSDKESNPHSNGKVRKSNKPRKKKHKSNISWEQQMTALFGDHADWGSMRVITRHRPPGTIVPLISMSLADRNCRYVPADRKAGQIP